MWQPAYKHDIEYKPDTDTYEVIVSHNGELIQTVSFSACNAALSFVERREEGYAEQYM